LNLNAHLCDRLWLWSVCLLMPPLELELMMMISLPLRNT